ncbi:hypothetical protein TOK_2459 [Pseudonocardia sp. N23]|nr:hypothetical protein TOK_2459 [Pseudonocardia sp. N23]
MSSWDNPAEMSTASVLAETPRWSAPVGVVGRTDEWEA